MHLVAHGERGKCTVCLHGCVDSALLFVVQVEQMVRYLAEVEAHAPASYALAPVIHLRAVDDRGKQQTSLTRCPATCAGYKKVLLQLHVPSRCCVVLCRVLSREVLCYSHQREVQQHECRARLPYWALGGPARGAALLVENVEAAGRQLQKPPASSYLNSHNKSRPTPHDDHD